MLEIAAILLLLAAATTARASTAEAGRNRLPAAAPVSGERWAAEVRPRLLAVAPGAACLLAGVAAGLLVPLPLGLLAAPGVFHGARFLLGRVQSAPKKQPPDQMLAMCADLLAACLEAGALPAEALAATGGCLPAPLGPVLVQAGLALADGATVAQSLPEAGPLGPVAAVFRRSSLSGSSMTDQLIAVAEQLREDAQFAKLERAHRVGVLSALPLGLCMLPAFLLLAVVPAITGLGTGLLG